MVRIKLSLISLSNKLTLGLIEILLWIGTILKKVSIQIKIKKKKDKRVILLNESITKKNEAMASMIIVGPAINNIV